MKYLVKIRHISQLIPIPIIESRNLEGNYGDKGRSNRKLPAPKVVAAGRAGVFTGRMSGGFHSGRAGAGSFFGRRRAHASSCPAAGDKGNEAREIRMTFEDGDDLYLIRGYGEQKTGGYSIAVDACTEDEEKLYLTTRLIGPEDAEKQPKDAIVSVYRGAGGGDRERGGNSVSSAKQGRAD